MRKKKNFSYLKKLVGYLVESRNYFYIIAVIFLLGSFFGFIFNGQLGFLDEMLKLIMEKVSGLEGSQIPLFIFQNNLSSSFFAMIFGVFLGIVPLFNATFNGVILGYVFAKASAVAGPGVFLKILPHGVFELPAIIIALGMGLRLGTGFLENYFIYYKRNSLKRFFGVVALLIGFLGFLFLPIALSGLVSKGGVLLSFVSLILGTVLIVPLISLFFGETKLRKIQKDVFLYRFSQAVRVFVFIVLPLLAIAAIIEGILIALYV